MFSLRMSLLSSALLVLCHAGTAPPGDDANNNNPMMNMFRNFASSFPPYANPLNFIPPQAFPPGGGYAPFVPAGGYGAPGGYGGPYYGGMGYAGPFGPGGFGQPSPAYGNVGGGGGGSNRSPPGTVPVLDTRLAGGQGSGGNGNSVVKTSDGRYASVSVQSSPDGKPIYRSQTVTGPDSYGTAFAYSSG